VNWWTPSWLEDISSRPSRQDKLAFAAQKIVRPRNPAAVGKGSEGVGPVKSVGLITFLTTHIALTAFFPVKHGYEPKEELRG
jgi:hypothetical protein